LQRYETLITVLGVTLRQLDPLMRVTLVIRGEEWILGARFRFVRVLGGFHHQYRVVI
jgi:hypothetical protein